VLRPGVVPSRNVPRVRTRPSDVSSSSGSAVPAGPGPDGQVTGAELSVIECGLVPYQQAWDRQREVHTRRVADEIPDTVLLVQHPPVFTAGRRTAPGDRPFDGTPVVDVDRGGKITWHGPGQLVGYPILKLAEPIDVVAYVRRLETLLMDVCGSLGLPGTIQVEGRSGVWVPADDRGPERKVAAIGVRVARGVTLHGFALNCDPDLTWYDRIVPCGIPDAGVTSLTAELGRTITVADATAVLRPHLSALHAVRVPVSV
jgi:lipoyl(octanoyl) transferase